MVVVQTNSVDSCRVEMDGELEKCVRRMCGEKTVLTNV